MPNEAEIQTDRALDEGVSDLLSQLEEDAAREASGAREGSAPPLPPSAAASGPGPAEADSEAFSGPDSGLQVEQAPGDTAPPVSGSSPAPAAGPGPAAQADTPPPSPEYIQSLDEELAGVADDLLGDGGGSDHDTHGAQFAPAMPAVAALSPENYRPRPATAPEEPPSPAADAPEEPEDDAEANEPATPAETAAAPFWMPMRTHAETHLYTALSTLSSPLAARPPSVRTAVGWAAMFNIVLAMCVWIYVLFLRPDEAPPPRAAATASYNAAAKAKASARSDPAKKPAKKTDSH